MLQWDYYRGCRRSSAGTVSLTIPVRETKHRRGTRPAAGDVRECDTRPANAASLSTVPRIQFRACGCERIVVASEKLENELVFFILASSDGRVGALRGAHCRTSVNARCRRRAAVGDEPE